MITMNRTTIGATLIALCLVALPLTAAAKGNPAAGKSKSVTCQACHGLDGQSITPEYPNIGGQHESYLVKALRDYRDGRRSNPVMGPMAAGLSDQDIKDLAAWYASQQGLEDLSIN